MGPMKLKLNAPSGLKDTDIGSPSVNSSLDDLQDPSCLARQLVDSQLFQGPIAGDGEETLRVPHPVST